MPEDYDYQGPAVITVNGTEVTVDLALRGHHQGIDGIYRWYGRIRPHPALPPLIGLQSKALVRTPFSTAPALIGDIDLWGRYRITGKSTPPFFVPRTLADIDGDSAQH